MQPKTEKNTVVHQLHQLLDEEKMSSVQAVCFEDIIQDLGGCGRFQVILTTVVHTMKCVGCFTMVAMTFGAAVPDWWCLDNLIGHNTSDVLGNKTLPQFQSCSYGNGTNVCSKFLYAASMKTVVTEWNLLCSRAWITQTITSIQMAGALVGNLLCGQVADLIGRKPPLFSALVALIAFNFLAAFSTSWQMFAIIRFFLGLACGFHITVCYNLQSEFMLARWRAWIVAVPSWAIELTLFAMVAWLLKDWQHIHIVTACIGVPLLATWWFVPESFRWYVSHDRIKDAERSIRFLAKINGHTNLDIESLIRLAETERKRARERQLDRKYTVLDIFKDRELVKLTLLLAWIWFTVGLCGYGIQFGIQKLSGDLYLNMFLLGVMGIPFNAITIYLSNRIGRKKTIWLFFFGSTVTAVLVGIAKYIDDDEAGKLLANICAITSLILLNAGWSTLQIVTIEVYPTVVRNIGYGSLNTLCRIGAIVGPQLVFLSTMVPGLLYFVCAIACLVSIVLLIPIPETKGRDLRDLIEITTIPIPETKNRDLRDLSENTATGEEIRTYSIPQNY